MQSAMQRLREVDWDSMRRDGHTIFTKLIRTRDPRGREPPPGPPGPPGPHGAALPGKQRLARCLTTRDLTSLGVGSCVGTGMYLVSGMVSRKFAGPGVVISFIIAAVASIFSGGCYAEFGVRVPNTTGSAYTYSYVAVGEFIAFVIGWNMVLEYLIGTSACARALSASLDSLCDGSISRYIQASLGTVFGKPPDFIACGISLLMTAVLVAGVRKSLMFNNLLNAINFVVWVFLLTAGLFYVDFRNWSEHQGFLPYGWTGVFSGAATCFYAFIGFDIIATTGEEANNPKRSIPLAIVLSLGIILVAYVTSSMMLTLIVPYDKVDMDSALVQMFAYVHAPTCKYVVAVGALAGLTVSMFGSMFPMPRVIYAMANDGLIFKRLANISEATGTPALATVCGGVAAALVALVTQLEVLVEMMSIGTLLAYTLVSSCVLVLRYQPNYSNLIELLPQSLRTPAAPEGTAAAHRETTFAGRNKSQVTASSQPVITRRVTRSSPDSDDTMPGDDSEEFGRDDSFLVNANTENKFYGAVPGGSTGAQSGCGRLLEALARQLRARAYLCPALCPWVDLGPASDQSGMFVIKSTGVMFLLIILLDVLAAYGDPSGSTFTTILMIGLALAIFVILLLISRKPQNRANLGYCAPGLPFVPATAVFVNIYLILNLSILTLVRFTLWMIVGLVVYFKYGIWNSTLERAGDEEAASPPTPGPLARATLPPRAPPAPLADRNIFEGDGNSGLYGNFELPDPLLGWHETELQAAAPARAPPAYKQVESRYNAVTNSTSTHTARRPPPWAYPDREFDSWDD